MRNRTHKISAGRLLRISRILRRIVALRGDHVPDPLLNAQMASGNAAVALQRYSDFLNLFLKTNDEDKRTLTRKFSNLFTMEDTESGEFFEDAVEDFNSLANSIKPALEKAKKQSSQQEIKKTILSQKDSLKRLLHLMSEIATHVGKTKYKHHKQPEQYRIYSDGVISQGETFVGWINEALGFEQDDIDQSARFRVNVH